MVNKEEPILVFLMETKLKKDWLELIKEKCRMKNCFVVPSIGNSGGLILLWKDDLRVDVQTFSQNHTDAWVDGGELGWWHFTGFYGHPNIARRHESWAKLKQLKVHLPYHGWLLVILMRLLVFRRRRVDVFVLESRWRSLCQLLIILDYMIWVLLGLSLLGSIKQLLVFE